MELRNLKTFQVAADLLNFTKTAQSLNFSQPTVTAQIHTLEKEIDCPLFFRIGKQTFLTSQGLIVKNYADKIFNAMTEMNEELNKSNSTGKNKMVIAASETFCTHYFPIIIRKYLEESPHVSIKLLSRYSNQVISGINNNDIDIGIISGNYQKSGITNVTISDWDDLILIVSSSLSVKYELNTIRDRFPFIRYDIEGPFHQKMQNFIEEAGIAQKNVIESSSLEAVKKAVLNDIGIGLISRNLVKTELSDGRLIEIHLNTQPVGIKTSLIIASQKLNDKKTMRLIEIIEQNWQPML